MSKVCKPNPLRAREILLTKAMSLTQEHKQSELYCSLSLGND